ncbi:MAG: hypothetical protein V9F00_02395 [Nocardioides sp.]
MLACGFGEGLEHDPSGDPGVGGDVQGVAGVVVEPGDDLGVAARAAGWSGVVEAVVGEVGLPGLVGLLGGEADVGGLGPFLWLGFDEVVPGQDPRDGADRDLDVVVVFQVPGQRVGAGIETSLDQLFAQRDDQVDCRLRGRGRTGFRTP